MGHSQQDDDNRLPDGMVLTGYDVDSGRRYYLDSDDGSTWMGAPYVRYGILTRVETARSPEESDEERSQETEEEFGSFDAEQDDDDDNDNDAEAHDSLSESSTQVADDHDCQSIESSASKFTATTSRLRAGSVTPTQVEHESEPSLPGPNGDTTSVGSLPMYVPSDSTKNELPCVAGEKPLGSNPDAKMAATLAEPSPNDAKWKRPMLRQITRFIMATKRKMHHGSSELPNDRR